MEVFNWKKTNCHTILALASVMCTIIFRGVTCQGNVNAFPSLHTANVRGDSRPPTERPRAGNGQWIVYPNLNESTVDEAKTTESTEVKVVCVDEATVRDRNAVKLKLQNVSSCEENKAKIQSIREHLCGDGTKLEIYQKDQTNEMVISGECVEGDVKGMTGKFDNDNIRDKVGIIEAEPMLVNQSQIVLISVLIAGLLLAVLLIVAYILKTHHREAKGACLAEDLFQVDEQYQGNTLLSVAPLPPQEPVEKPTSNGESLDSPPTNGHSATQTPVADSEM